jgi:hypothetical protein
MLGAPKLNLKRAPNPTSPIHSISITRDKVNLLKRMDDDPSNKKLIQTGTITLLRAIALREIYRGRDETFAMDATELIKHYMNPPQDCLINGLALTHPELHEYARDTFNITSCTTVPMGIPISQDITPVNHDSPSHLLSPPTNTS